jgi:hypothetical protein
LASASFWSAPGLEHDQAAAAGPDRLCGLRAVRHHRGPAPLEGLLQNWILPFTEFVPQLLLALMTVQLFEELGCAGLVQHRATSPRALNASFFELADELLEQGIRNALALLDAEQHN